LKYFTESYITSYLFDNKIYYDKYSCSSLIGYVKFEYGIYHIFVYKYSYVRSDFIEQYSSFEEADARLKEELIKLGYTLLPPELEILL
jgi:hypothetical protein